jgi:hypothetical protein
LPRVDPRLRGNGGVGRLWSAHWPAAMVALLLACALLPLAQPAPGAAAPLVRATEWPTQFDGRALRPLATSAVERRFAARFPGATGRFTDGEQVFVLRAVERPTRLLHPAADCFRGLGYRIEQARLEVDGQRRLWRCFEARAADGQRLRVCERIEAGDGTSFVDASAWFWAASLGRSTGPWLAVTRVEAL